MTSNEPYPLGYFGIFDITGIDARTLVFVDGGIFEKHGICHEMKKDTRFFVKFPENSRYYLPKESETPWEFLYLHFTGEALAPYVDKLEHISDGIFSLNPSSESIRMLLQFQESIIDGEKIENTKGTEFIQHFFCTLLKDIDEWERENSISIVRKAVKIMNEEYRELEGIQHLADQLGISQEYFCRLFKSEMKISPGQYLTDLRISSARHDLLNTTENLEAIAQKNGFSNANYFGKVFKKSVGVTPIQYRNEK